MKECKICTNNSTVRKIEFDENGICNYCNNYKKIESKLNDKSILQKLFENRINKIKENKEYKYDACIGISGGKDSAYVLYEAINKYNLHVKAFTMDNGFLSEKAKENIDALVKEFNVEHEYITFEKEFLKRVYKYSMDHWLVPCIACSYLGYASMINYTIKINAGMCIHGRSPQQMFRYYDNDVFSQFVNLGLQDIDKIDIDLEYRKILNSISQKLNNDIMNEVKTMVFDNIQGKKLREFVPYFLYNEYDEKEIVKFLRENTKWDVGENYNHYDCKIHSVPKYIYQCAEGRAHILPEVSVLVRQGRITKQEANEILKNEKINKPKDEIKLLKETANINANKSIIKAKLYNLIKG